MNTLFLIGAICYIVLALGLVYRIARGPSTADRLVAADSLDLITSTALVLYALSCGRMIYLDIALVVAILGFISTVFISRYLEGRV